MVTEAEGLRLHLSGSNATGYLGVRKLPSGRFQARREGGGGRQVPIGNFDTALEAAGAYARHVQSLESA